MSVNPRRARRTAVAATCLISAVLVGGTGVAQADTPPPAGLKIVPGSVAQAVASSGKVVGSVPASQHMSVQFWLAADQAGATAYADTVSDPRSADFRHYLSPADYTARFGPSAAAAAAVSSWLTQQGFTGISVDTQRNYVRANAPVSTVQKALHVQMKTFSVAGSSTPVTSNDRDVTLPASLADDVIGISGLDNLQPKTMLAAPKPSATAASDGCSTYYGQNVQTGLPPINGTTTLPTNVCGYSGTQLRAVYGMNDANNGKGVTVAYVEDGTPYKMFGTLQKWAQAGGLPAPQSQNYSELVLGQGDACGNPFDIEEQLDIEAGYAMAPGQHQLLVGGDSCDQRGGGIQAVVDADLTVLDGNGQHPLASLVSNSWEIPRGEGGPGDQYDSVLHSVLLRAAGEGVGMYYSSGDGPGVLYPSSDPYALAVGGTSLGVDAANKRLFETGWSDDTEFINSAGTGYTDLGIVFAAGGGASLLWNEPFYQKGVVPGSMAKPPAGDQRTARAVPDISAVADLTTGIGEATTEPGTNGGPDTYTTFLQGGTSLAAPLVAGMVAAAQQGQPVGFGFLNPLLYSLAGTKALHDVLPVTASTPEPDRVVYCEAHDCGAASVWTFDAQTAAETNQVTAIGYDTMSGLGTPNGQTFISALRK